MCLVWYLLESWLICGCCLTSDPLLIDDKTCVRECGNMAVPVNGSCEPCEGMCPKGTILSSHAITVVSVSISLIWSDGADRMMDQIDEWCMLLQFIEV